MVLHAVLEPVLGSSAQFRHRCSASWGVTVRLTQSGAVSVRFLEGLSCRELSAHGLAGGSCLPVAEVLVGVWAPIPLGALPGGREPQMHALSPLSPVTKRPFQLLAVVSLIYELGVEREISRPGF